MANTKKVSTEEEVADVTAEPVAAPIGNSVVDWTSYLESLKTKNPAKYEAKKAEYEARVKNA